MLTPDQLESLPRRILALLAEMDADVRGVMAADLIDPQGVKRSASRAKIGKVVASYKVAADGVIRDTYADAARTALNSDEATYSAARASGIVASYPALAHSGAIDSLLADGLLTATNAMNLTMTAARVTYISEFTAALDEALVGLAGAVIDPTRAISRAVARVAMRETVIRYVTEAGVETSTSIYAATRRAVLTGLNQTTQRITFARAAETGIPLMWQVSAHMGARPEHAEWQGGIYTEEELGDICGYGAVDGLCGANCRHAAAPYIEGVSEATDWGVTDDDGEAYALSQEQRLSERNVRAYSTREAAYRSAASSAGPGQVGDKARSDAAAAHAKRVEWRDRADAAAKKRAGRRRPERERGGKGYVK